MFGKSHFKMASSSSPIRAFGTVVGGQSRYATGSYADIESYALVSGLAKAQASRQIIVFYTVLSLSTEKPMLT